MELYEHQKKIIDTIPNKAGLWARPRTGKTPTSIRLACSRGKSCIVLTPKHIKEQWEAEIEKWNNTGCKFQVVTKERFRIDSIKEVKKRGRGKTLIFSDKFEKADTIIIDEVHRQASNPKTKFFKTVKDYIDRHNIQNVFLLSGTPWNKNPLSLFSYLSLLGYNVNFHKWQQDCFVKVSYGPKSFYKPDERKFPRLVQILSKIGVTVKLEDVIGEQEDCEQIEYFDLNHEQKGYIKNITDTTPGARYVKRHQLEQGVLKSDGYSEGLSFECEKDKRILELMEEEDKLIIVCRYLDQIQKYEQLAQKENRRFYTIRGGQKDSATEIAARANAREKCIVFIQADCSDGYSLKDFDTMVFASMSYSFISFDQMKNRTKSMFKKNICQYYYLLSRGNTIDNAIYKSVEKGQDFSEKLYNS